MRYLNVVQVQLQRLKISSCTLPRTMLMIILLLALHLDMRCDVGWKMASKDWRVLTSVERLPGTQATEKKEGIKKMAIDVGKASIDIGIVGRDIAAAL